VITPGGVFGRYAVLALLGTGAMGEVYAAYDRELDRKVALKFVRGGDGPSNVRKRARLLREARAIARLRHPSVVGVHDAGGGMADQARGWLRFADAILSRLPSRPPALEAWRLGALGTLEGRAGHRSARPVRPGARRVEHAGRESARRRPRLRGA